MYKRATYRIRSNEPLTETVYRMVVEGDTQYLTAPGQFVNIELPGRFLRRPISVCDYDGHTITLIYKVIGEGTAQMAGMAVGGGVGVPPLYNLAKRLLAEGRRVSVVLGFNTASEVFYAEEFEALGVDVTVATADGSRGMRGFVTDVLADGCTDYDYVYACGPMPMLRALSGAIRVPGQFSFEERMGCGFGGCMGCTCHTRNGNKRICKEGPVLTTDEIIWEER